MRPMRREQWIDAVEMGVELGMRKAEQTAERIMVQIININ